MADKTPPRRSGLLSYARELARAAVTRAIERLTGQPLSERGQALLAGAGLGTTAPVVETVLPAATSSSSPVLRVTLPSSPAPQVVPLPSSPAPQVMRPRPITAPSQVPPEPTGPTPTPPPAEPFGLLDLEEVPELYGIDEVGLLVRDTQWLVAYWEVTASAWERARRELGGDGVLILRVMVEAADRPTHFHDERLPWDHGRRGLRPPRTGCTLTAAVGLIAPDGRFAMMASAPRVHVPPTETSPGVPTWMDVEPQAARPLALSSRPRIRAVGDVAQVAAVSGAPVDARRAAWLAASGKLGFGTGERRRTDSSPSPGARPGTLPSSPPGSSASSPGKRQP
jgi:hypothetical protein